MMKYIVQENFLWYRKDQELSDKDIEQFQDNLDVWCSKGHVAKEGEEPVIEDKGENINIGNLSEDSKERVKDIVEDLADDGKRNRSNKKSNKKKSKIKKK